MKNNDLYNKLKDIVNEELNSLINERSYKFGGILDPKDFDPVDPQIHVVGFGTMSRTSLRKEIVTRLEGALKSAKSAASNPSVAYDTYKTLEGILGDDSVLMLQMKADIEVSDQLEDLRKKGGRRAIPIPPQK
jgi:hypothetical protein